MKLVNIDGENVSERFEKFQSNFQKDVTYDNAESHKKPGLHPLSKRYISGETTGECQIDS